MSQERKGPVLIKTNGNGNGNGHHEGVLVVDSTDQTNAVRALRENVKNAVDWEYQEVCDRLNLWADRVKTRFFDCIVYPDRPPLPDPVIGIAPMRHNTLAGYSLTRNPQGLLYEITFNQRHFKDEEGRRVWVYGGEYGMVETLTHELAHLWQQNGGGKEPFKQGAKETHNREFRDRLADIGLHCDAGGAHTAPADGAFEAFMREYGITKPEIPQEGVSFEDWMKWFAEFFKDYKPKGRSTLHKWSCPECGLSVNATTRKDISLICGECKAETGNDIFFVRSERRRKQSHQLKPKQDAPGYY